MSWSSKEIAAVLVKKGFQQDDKDHHYFYLYRNNKRTHIFTKISHGSDEYGHGNPVFHKIKKQLFLKTKELDQLLDCRLDGPGYLLKLIEGHQIHN